MRPMVRWNHSETGHWPHRVGRAGAGAGAHAATPSPPPPPMSASTVPVPLPAPSAGATPRVLGALGMLASPVFLAQWIASGRTLAGLRVTTATTTLLGMLYLVGWAASAIGMRRQRATGRGRGGALVLALLGVGLALGFLQQIQDLFGR